MFNVTTSEYMINKASLQDNELRQLFFFWHLNPSSNQSKWDGEVYGWQARKE